MIISAKKRDFFYIVKLDDRTISVPDDMENSDRQELQRWLDAGNSLEEDNSGLFLSNVPTYNWQGLAIRFEISQLNQVLTKIKDESTNPLASPIWRISDDLAKVITLNIFSDEDRIGRMNRELIDLFDKLKAGEVSISAEIKNELVDGLATNGFNQTAEIIKEIEINY